MIQRDYDNTAEDILESLRERIPDYREGEMEEWERAGRFDMRVIDGEKRFLGPSVSNLLFRYPDIRARVPKDGDPFHKRLVQEARNASAVDRPPGVSLITPRRFHIKMTVTPDEDALPQNGIIRCWLPFPRAFPFQTDIRLLKADPDPKWISQPESAQRTIYFETPIENDSGRPVSFEIEYAFTAYTRSLRIDPALAADAVPPSVRAYTGEEEPHVVFSKKMRRLADEITGVETNHAVVARKLYDWCVENLQYSYAPEYATIRNISDWVYERRYGDCGQKALFYITLCRIKGIPARWQSSWMLFPELTGLHDWCEIYLHPYGWVPVDISLAMGALESPHLDKSEKTDVVNFLFGSMDHWRMVANAEHCAEHTPPKSSWRTDPVDSQRGELEANGETIPFHQFKRTLEVVRSDLLD